LPKLLDAGLCAMVNSDDPSYFGGYINDNFLQTFAATGMTAQHAYQLARNSFEASFLDESAKRHHIDKLKEVFENFE
jgi:adenosine deaminase